MWLTMLHQPLDNVVMVFYMRYPQIGKDIVCISHAQKFINLLYVNNNNIRMVLKDLFRSLIQRTC